MKNSYGFIHDKLDVKILILLVLRLQTEPISIEELTELTMCDEGVTYFDFMECAADLVKTEHIKLKEDMYTITEKGVRNGTLTEKSLPPTVRARAEDSVLTYRSKKNRNAMIKTKNSVNRDGGCVVNLSLSDGIGEIVSVNLLAMSERQARIVEQRFREKAESVYKMLISMLLE